MPDGRRRATIAAALLAAGAPLAGCAGIRAPGFEVLSVALESETDEAFVLDFTLRATNDNDEAVPLREIRYTLTLEGKRVFSGVRSAEVTLPPGGVQIITLPASVLIAEGVPTPDDERADYRLAGAVTYLAPGSIAELLFDANVRRPTAHFADAGVLEFSDP